MRKIISMIDKGFENIITAHKKLIKENKKSAMKPTKEIKDQIRKMADAKYPVIGEDAYLQTEKHYAMREGGEAVVERLDIDDTKLTEILLEVALNKAASYNQAKHAILEAIRISG